MLKRGMILLLCAALAAPAFAGGYGHGYHYGYSGYYGHRGGGEGEALLAGLLIGGLIGWFVNEDRHYRRDAYWDDPYYYDAPRYRSYGYEPRRYRQYVRVVPRTTAPATADAEFAGQACRMTREYTTIIEIDGERHDAYGTKCLTADGSWVLGRPKLVPEFD